MTERAFPCRRVVLAGLLGLLPSVAFLVPSAQAAPNDSYVVQAGDTLSGISKKLGVSSSTLSSLNPGIDPRRLQIGQVLKVPPQYRVYKVKSGDTFGQIASSHKMSVAQLAAYNNISKPELIRVGQEIKIPTNPSAPEAARARPQLAQVVRDELERVRVNAAKWKYIVIHHSASSKGSLASMDRYHREERHMENGLAYHFVIGNGVDMRDGEVGVGNRWKRQIQGGHLASSALNEKSIGICLVGNFESTRPTAAQLRNLQALLDYLIRKTNVAASGIRTHRQINPRPTACPGKNFPTPTMQSWF